MILKSKTLTSRQSYRYDLPIRIIASLVAAYIVTEYGGNEPLLPRLLDPTYYVEFGSTLLITLLDIHTVFLATRWLDRRYDWHAVPLIRIPLQLLLGVLLPTVITFLLATAYFRSYGINILDTNYHLYALPFIALLITLCNVYYYVRYLLAEREGLQQARQQTASTARFFAISNAPSAPGEGANKTMFLAQTPTRTIPVPVSDIAYFFRERGRVYVRLGNGMDYFLSQSLEQIEATLDNQVFFRAARHAIVSKNAVSAFCYLDYGKLGLSLKPDYKEMLVVSKLQARDFKKWLDR